MSRGDPLVPASPSPAKPRGDTHAPLAGHPLAEEAVDAFLAGLAAVEPTMLVKRAVRQGLLDDWLVDREKPRMIHVLALGKAAPRMLWGLVEGGVPFRGLGVAPKGVPAPGVDTFRWLPGEHPVPGENSFKAGAEVAKWADAFPKDEPLLVLLSGGASACAELPAPGLSTIELQERWRGLLRSGKSIEDVNRERANWSALKGGKLGRRLLARTRKIRVWMVCDTEPADAGEAVGSGPFWVPDKSGNIDHDTLATNDDLVAHAGIRLGAKGFTVYRHPERLRSEVKFDVDAFLTGFHRLKADGPIALVGGGEPTVELPADAPPGGRAQHAALAAARWLGEAKSDALFAAFASDGVDGTTDAAGAWVIAGDWDEEAKAALEAFGATRFLRERKRLVFTGATGTNVNDLWVAVRR